MTKMKRALGIAVLLLGTALLVGCNSTPAEEPPAKPADSTTATNTSGGTPPGTNTGTAAKSPTN